jgi:hypothetical protein
MTAGQAANLCGSVAALAGALSFVLVYTLFAPWWTYRVGRLLVFKALVISGFMIVSIVAYIVNPDSGTGREPLFMVRGVLAGGFGLMMTYQAWLVSREQIRGASRRTGGAWDERGPKIMSSDAKMRQVIGDAVREATEPLKEAVEALSARLAAVEGSDGAPDDGTQKRGARGRTARAKTQPAETTAAADDEAKPGAAKESGE